MSRAVAIVGGTGCGKTFFTKQLIAKVNKSALMIFDVNNEYGTYYPYPFDADIDKFLNRAYRKKNCVILIEDATAFLSNRGRADVLQKILVGKRHTNNTVILLFHSFRALPKYIMDLCNTVVIFKTNDPEKIVSDGFQNPELTKAWRRVQDAAKNHPFFATYPRPKGVVPPSLSFDLY